MQSATLVLLDFKFISGRDFSLRPEDEFNQAFRVKRLARGRKMRMKLKKPGQMLLVTAASIGVATLLSACTQLTGTLTVDFVYVTSARAAGSDSYGEVDVFEVNSESGKMRQIPTSPFPSGGRNPVSVTASTDHSNLYVVNRDDNTIVRFAIGTDGKLYASQTVNTKGIFPVAATVSGSFIYVIDTYQPLPTCSTAAPCSGSVSVLPIKTAGALDPTDPISTVYYPLTVPGSPQDVVAPSGVTVSGSNVYVAAADTTTGVGYVFGFSSSSGTLTPLNGGVPFAAGIKPSAIAADPTGAYLYVTDYNSNNVLGWTIGGTGLLTPLSGSPFPAGGNPSAIVVDAKSKFVYVANAQDSNVVGYSLSGGNLTRIAATATDTEPVAIGIEPALNQYLYTVNFLGNTVSGFQIDSTAGTLLNSQNSPYAANANPTAVTAIPHGSAAK